MRPRNTNRRINNNDRKQGRKEGRNKQRSNRRNNKQHRGIRSISDDTMESFFHRERNDTNNNGKGSLRNNKSSNTQYSKLETNDDIDNGYVEKYNGNGNDNDNGNAVDGEVEMSTLMMKDDDEEVRRKLNDSCQRNGDDDDDKENLDIKLKSERLLQLWRWENLGIPMCYFTVGLVQGITYPLINVYPLDIGATEAQQATVWFAKGLPSCFKIVFGFISDNAPLCGYRRKGYMFLGWTVSCLSLLLLVCTSDLTLQFTDIPSSSSCSPSLFVNATNTTSLPTMFSNNTTTTTTTTKSLTETQQEKKSSLQSTTIEEAYDCSNDDDDEKSNSKNNNRRLQKSFEFSSFVDYTSSYETINFFHNKMLSIETTELTATGGITNMIHHGRTLEEKVEVDATVNDEEKSKLNDDDELRTKMKNIAAKEQQKQQQQQQEQQRKKNDVPSMAYLTFIFFFWAIGVWGADVMGDSLVAERAKYESVTNRGNIQATCYILRGIGIAITMPISSYFYSVGTNNDYNNGPYLIIVASMICPIIFVLPFWYLLKEEKVIIPENETYWSMTKKRRTETIQQLWKTACSKAVWQPMGFMFLYVTLFVYNAAWKEFLKSVVLFTPNQLNGLLFIAGILGFGGVILYKFCLMDTSWRYIFGIGMVINFTFSLLQIVLIYHPTNPFGLHSPFLFALGDDSVRDFLLGTQYLPMCVMMVNLVPSGIEGTSYALFTTSWNASSALSDSLSTILLSIWDVSKSTMLAGDLSGLTKLTILTTVIQTIPLAFVGFLPHSVDDLKRLQQQQQQQQEIQEQVEREEEEENVTRKQNNDNDHNNFGTEKRTTTNNNNVIGGTIYLSTVFLAVVFAVFIGIMNVLHPGWMGES